MYVISGTEESQLKKVAEELDVHKYFLALFGSSQKKPENIGSSRDKSENFKRVMKCEGNQAPPSFVVIGDGEEDARLAQEIGCEFIGIANEWNEWNGMTGINGMHGMHRMNGMHGMNGMTGMNEMNGMNGMHGMNGMNGMNA